MVTASINKRSHLPYYYQLASLLREQIQQKENSSTAWLLPSENELARLHQISRATVRQALGLLEREGLIYTAKGKGTFAAKSRARYQMTALIPTTDDMLRRGWQPQTQLIYANKIETHEPITSALEIAEEAYLFEICRLRLGNGEPVSLQWSYLDAERVPGILEHDLTGSLTHLVEEVYGIRFWSAHEILRARLVTPFEARHLQVPAGSPVIYTEQVTYSPAGQPVEFLQSVWRSDRYDFEFNLLRGGI